MLLTAALVVTKERKVPTTTVCYTVTDTVAFFVYNRLQRIVDNAIFHHLTKSLTNCSDDRENSTDPGVENYFGS